jgi:hypothetical protein
VGLPPQRVAGGDRVGQVGHRYVGTAGGGRRRCKRFDRGFQRQPIAVAAEAADHADRDVRQVRVVPERLARVHVGQVHFDEGDRHRGQRVAQGNAGMGERAGVEQDQRGLVVAGLLDAADQLVLGVGLEPGQLMPGCLRALG